MSITVKVHANNDDALIAWKCAPWPDAWTGFMIERKNLKTGQITPLNNRIPAKAGAAPLGDDGLSSQLSPFLRCIWTDHSVDAGDRVAYRVTAVKADGAPDAASASDWVTAGDVSADAGDGLAGYFNRGTLMSQIVSRIVNDAPTIAALKSFKARLAQPGFAPRSYLSGDARHEILDFLGQAHRRGNEIYAALYEFNDVELVEAIKSFGPRGNILIGNGSATKDGLPDELRGAHLKVHERDLSKKGESSPSVHNKFVVERDPKAKKNLRVLTGSTNWTVTGLCTQLNNVLIVDRPATADRFHDQWQRLVASGDDITPELRASNGRWSTDGPVSTAFAATTSQADFAPVLELIKGAKDGIFFLMFMPGQSPLLQSILDRADKDRHLYARGVVSTVTQTKNGTITAEGAHVVKTGSSKKFSQTAILPEGVGQDAIPSWEREEFTRKMFLAAGLNAIVHSKTIVVDPFSDNCAVVTGSHNFSLSASEKNDENLVIVRGNKRLAQAYALHIQGVYDHYSWRAFLAEGGKPNTLFDGLKAWKPGGSRAREVDFWVR